jgi:hypothetical protein
MEDSTGRPRNPYVYEQVSDRMREQDAARARAFATAPLGPFLLRQLLWALAGGVLGYLFGGWVPALVMFLGWGLAALPVRWWFRRKYINGHADPSAPRP